MLQIQKMLVKYNFNKGSNKPKFIVIHDTGNPRAGAYNHYLYFNGGNRGASAHYFVDTDNTIQIIEDNDAAWHCGDGKGKYGITNRNSIGIEICINDMKNINKVVDHTIDLTVYLMKKYNISIDKVVRHYDASRKSCPNVMSKNSWAKWWEFKTLVQAKLRGGYENMTKEEVIKIVREIIKPSTKGEREKHWADESYQNLKNKGIEIHNRRLDDLVTRGELFALEDRILENVYKKIENIK